MISWRFSDEIMQDLYFSRITLNDSMSALDNVMVSGLLKNKDRKALAE